MLLARTLLALAGLAALSHSPRPASPPPTAPLGSGWTTATLRVPARVRAIEGLAQVLGREGTLEIRAGTAREIPGAAVLELGWGDVAEVSWPGQASARVVGPASLEWSAPWSTAHALEWRFQKLRRIEAEVRSGPVRVVLEQGGWTIGAGASAFAIEGLPSGAARVSNHAGVALEATGSPRNGGQRRIHIPQGSAARLKALVPRD